MNDKTFLSGVAIIGLVVLESIAMLSGNDGAYFTIIAAAVAGIAGYSLGQQESIKALATNQELGPMPTKG